MKPVDAVAVLRLRILEDLVRAFAAEPNAAHEAIGDRQQLRVAVRHLPRIEVGGLRASHSS